MQTQHKSTVIIIPVKPAVLLAAGKQGVYIYIPWESCGPVSQYPELIGLARIHHTSNAALEYQQSTVLKQRNNVSHLQSPLDSRALHQVRGRSCSHVTTRALHLQGFGARVGHRKYCGRRRRLAPTAHHNHGHQSRRRKKRMKERDLDKFSLSVSLCIPRVEKATGSLSRFARHAPSNPNAHPRKRAASQANNSQGQASQAPQHLSCHPRCRAQCRAPHIARKHRLRPITRPPRSLLCCCVALPRIGVRRVPGCAGVPAAPDPHSHGALLASRPDQQGRCTRYPVHRPADRRRMECACVGLIATPRCPLSLGPCCNACMQAPARQAGSLPRLLPLTQATMFNAPTCDRSATNPHHLPLALDTVMLEVNGTFPDGMFLVRERPGHEGDLVLSVCYPTHLNTGEGTHLHTRRDKRMSRPKRMLQPTRSQLSLTLKCSHRKPCAPILDATQPGPVPCTIPRTCKDRGCGTYTLPFATYPRRLRNTSAVLRIAD